MVHAAGTCAIWGSQYRARVFHEPSRRISFIESDRTGGLYSISREAELRISSLTDTHKAILTTWLLDQRQQGVEEPLITDEIVSHIPRITQLSVDRRAERLLRFVADKTQRIGDRVTIPYDDPLALAWSESTTSGELEFLLEYLQNHVSKIAD